MVNIFTDDEIASFNDYQQHSDFPKVACADNHAGEHNLIANSGGIFCPTCGWRQNWVHKFLIDWSWRDQVEQTKKWLATISEIKRGK